MTSLNLRDTALLIQNGKTAIKCQKCQSLDIPHIKKSHDPFKDGKWLHKVECAHCGAYIKFINEKQLESEF